LPRQGARPGGDGNLTANVLDAWRDLAVRLDEGSPTYFSCGVHSGQFFPPGFVTAQGFEKGTFPFILTACRFQSAGKTGFSESMQDSVAYKASDRVWRVLWQV